MGKSTGERMRSYGGGGHRHIESNISDKQREEFVKKAAEQAERARAKAKESKGE